MEYRETITLKDGRTCLLYNGTEDDAQELIDIFMLTHSETDHLLTYPDENSFDVKSEALYLKEKTDDPVGEWLYLWYRMAKKFGKHAEALYGETQA